MSNNIDASQWTLADKIFFGGLGYSSFCLPTNFFKVLIAILFPPLGEIINIIEDDITDTFPFFTWDSMKKLCTYNSLNTIVYSFLLTTLFYIPGLVYTLTNIVEKERKVNYDVQGQTIYEGIDNYGQSIRITSTNINGILYIKEISANRTKNIFQKAVSEITDKEQTAINNIKKNGRKSIDELTSSTNKSNLDEGIAEINSELDSGVSSIGGLF
jgi:uncharacterized membrane protein YqaE (UPF0057 family)